MKDSYHMSEHTEYLDNLCDIHELQYCLEEQFELDKATSKPSMLEWFKELIERYE